MHRALYPLILIALLLAISACSSRQTAQLPPLGPVSITGSLIPADMSLIRRGTHLLLVNGEKMYYVESKTVNLVNFEGQTVHIDGTAEMNTGKQDLPVLVASSVTAAMHDGSLHEWEIPTLDLKVSVPAAWRASIKKNVVAFSLAGEQVPLLTISLLSGATLPAGTPYYLSGHRAVRVQLLSGSGTTEDIVVQDRGFSLQLHFDASTQQSITRLEDATLLQSEFQSALSTLSFLSDRSPDIPASGSGVMIPCGGPAGILCPQGSFCNVTDFEARIGQCKTLK